VDLVGESFFGHPIWFTLVTVGCTRTLHIGVFEARALI
jgi:hypothetical protein